MSLLDSVAIGEEQGKGGGQEEEEWEKEEGGARADEGAGVNVAFTNHHSCEPDIGNLATHPRVLRKEDPSGSPPSLTPSPSPAIPPDPILPSCLVARRFAPFLVAIPAPTTSLRIPSLPRPRSAPQFIRKTIVPACGISDHLFPQPSSLDRAHLPPSPPLAIMGGGGDGLLLALR